MKKWALFLITLSLMITLSVLSACGKSEFKCTDNTEKTMTIVAENADKDDYFMTGSLEVSEGDKLVIHSDLEKGEVNLGFISSAGMDDIEKFPDVNTDSQITSNVSGTETQEYEISPGVYLLKATVIEKATGTVRINVQSSEAGKS